MRFWHREHIQSVACDRIQPVCVCVYIYVCCVCVCVFRSGLFKILVVDSEYPLAARPFIARGESESVICSCPLMFFFFLLAILFRLIFEPTIKNVAIV